MTSDRAVKAHQLRADGKSYREVGELMGVSPTRARQLSYAGSPDARARQQDGQAAWEQLRARVIALRADGKTYPEIERMTGVGAARARGMVIAHQRKAMQGVGG